MRFVDFRHTPGKRFPGYEVRVVGCRVHHGLIGLVLVVHDIKDWRKWLIDLIPHR